MSGCRVFHAPTRQNVFLDPGYADRLAEVLTPELAEQYLEGRFANTLTGRVYHHFDRSVHLRPLARRDDLPLCLCCDFNVDPMVWLIVQHEAGQVFVLDEIVMSQADTAAAAAEFLRRTGPAGQGVEVFGDAAGSHRDTRQVGRTDYTIIKEVIPGARLRVPRANPPVKDRVNAVNARLRNTLGEARLLVSPACRELVADLETLTHARAGQPGVVDKSDPARSHAADALGYFVARVYSLASPARGFRY